MKKTLIMLLALIGISAGNLFAQTSEDIYIIGTSVHSPIKPVTGLNKGTLSIKSGDRNPTITFTIYSEEKDYYYFVILWHLDYIKAPNDIVDRPMTFLSGLTVIDVEDFIETHNKRQAQKWMQDAYESGKKIWVIDRNDFYKSSPSLTSPDRMKLIPVIIFPESLPSERIVD